MRSSRIDFVPDSCKRGLNLNTVIFSYMHIYIYIHVSVRHPWLMGASKSEFEQPLENSSFIIVEWIFPYTVCQ